MSVQQVGARVIEGFNIGLVSKCFFPKSRRVEIMTATMQRKLRRFLGAEAREMGLRGQQKTAHIRKGIGEVRSGRVVVLPVQ